MPDPFDAPAPPTSSASSLTLSSFLSRFSEVEDEADGYVVVCPSHDDNSPSLRVGYNAEDRTLMLKCRAGCRTTDVVKALGLRMADLFGVDPGDEVVLRDAGRVPEKPSIGDRAALKVYLDRAAAALAEPAISYAFKRFGVTEEKAREIGLGYDDTTLPAGNLGLSRGKYHDAARLVVPFCDFEGRPHYLQARALVADGVRAKWSGPVNPEGAAWGKWGFFRGGTGWAEVVVTEGPGDGLTSAATGYDTLLIRGASLGQNAAMADEIAAGLRGRRVVVAGDTDTAGTKFTRDVAKELSDRGLDVHRLVIPDGAGGDLSEWRENAGDAFAKAFIRAVNDAPRYGSDQITVEEISQDLTRLFSDVYNARALLDTIREKGGDVRHTPEVGWVVYRPEIGTWKVDAEEWVRAQAQTVASRIQKAILAQMQSMDGRIATISDPSARDTVGKTLDAMRKKARSGTLVSYVMSTKGIDSMLREARALPGVFASYEDFDRHPHLLAVANGVVDLETGSLRPYGPDVKDLYLMRRIDVPFVKGARCPRWERFVDEIFEHFPDTEEGKHSGLPAFVKRLVGYGITGHTTEQALAVLYGGGSNGKGVLIETLTGLFKGITVTTPFSTFEQKPSGGIPNDIAALKGSRLVMASEGEQGRQMAESLIKRLTGGDTISARFMRKEFFEFTPTFLIVLATNYKPNFRGQDFGLWRRVKLVPFTRTFGLDDRDPHLTSKFLGRRVPTSAYRDGEDYGDGPAGILAWAVEGAVAWHRDGLRAPSVVDGATKEFKETSDKLGDFYEHYLTRDPDGRITGKDAWGLYLEWVEEEGLPSKERWTRSTFWGALEERGAVKRKSGGTVYFRGIRRARPSELENRSDEPRATEPVGTDLLPEVEAPALDPFTP